MAKATAIGIVVNPKLKSPVLVVWDGGEIEIWNLQRDGGRIGLGSYEDSDPTYLRAAYVTGFPRVHTPSGVRPRGKGYGTSLYTALCLGAHQNSEHVLNLGTDQFEGDGISSDAETRSPAASAWWDQAKKLGLADEVEDYQTEEDVEFDGSDLSCEFSDGNVDIDYARGSVTRLVVADTYSYSDATRADLVVASFEIDLPAQFYVGTGADRTLNPNALRGMWKAIQEKDGTVHDLESNALLALDVRDLEPQAVNLLSAIGAEWGVEDADIDALRIRAELNLDPSVPLKQMRLPFKPNAAEASEIQTILDQTQRLRAKLDWERLSSLP